MSLDVPAGATARRRQGWRETVRGFAVSDLSKSLRWRLQVWYALVLLIVISGFAGILYYNVRQDRLSAIDADLETAVIYLEANLRRFPPWDLEPNLLRGRQPDRGGPSNRRPDEAERSQPGRQAANVNSADARSEPPTPERGDSGRRGQNRDGQGRRDDPDGRGGRRRGPLREQLIADVRLPPSLAEANNNSPNPIYFGIWLRDGQLLKSSALPDETQFIRNNSRQPVFSRTGVFRQAALSGPQETTILAGQSIEQELNELQSFAWQLAGAGVVVLLVGLGGGWLASSRIARPLATISETASSISATNLSGRIDVAHLDRELVDLATILNATFQRLQESFEQQARFTADASHELRTPLAILQTHAELALSRPRAVEEYRESLATCLRTSQRMSTLVGGLLTLARADAGKLELRRQPVELESLVGEMVSLLQPLAEAKRLEIVSECSEAEIVGDPARLAQVITNLLSNAIHYNRPGGSIHIKLVEEPAAAIFSVTDAGCGIAAEDHPHIFERFYRVDKARARETGGSGLGLAICKCIVEAHGGTIGFNSKPNQGSTFWVRLPRTAPVNGQPA